MDFPSPHWITGEYSNLTSIENIRIHAQIWHVPWPCQIVFQIVSSSHNFTVPQLTLKLMYPARKSIKYIYIYNIYYIIIYIYISYHIIYNILYYIIYIYYTYKYIHIYISILYYIYIFLYIINLARYHVKLSKNWLYYTIPIKTRCTLRNFYGDKPKSKVAHGFLSTPGPICWKSPMFKGTPSHFVLSCWFIKHVI